MRLIVSCIPGDGGKSGISAYEREVVGELERQGHSLKVLRDEDWPFLARHPIASMMWHLFVLPLKLRAWRKEWDGFVICAANRRACAWYPMPTAATVHDLANFHIKGKYSRLRMFYLAHVLPFFAKRAHHLVAISESTKADMVKYWHCPPERVTVLYNGAPVVPSAAAGQKVRRTLLYISRIEHPGKNHVRLIEAYSRLLEDVARCHPLVLAGADWKDAEAVHKAAEASPHAKYISLTGFVDAARMEELWEEAYAYVFPSLFEGFGLSLVEAMVRGVPCACSANGSLGEIAADAAIVFDPLDTGAMAAALEKLLTMGEGEREELIRRGHERAKAFSWPKHAAGIAALVSEKMPARMFGINIARLTEDEALAKIMAMASSPRAERAKMVATLNVDFVANAVTAWPFKGDEELWGYLKGADFVTADGMPIVLLSRLLGTPIPERVTGADLVPRMCKEASAKGLGVYVLGGDAQATREAFAKMAIEGLRVCGIDDTFVKLDEDQPEIVGRINAAKPDILFVALGNPKQELWIGRNLRKLETKVVIGIGGTFNFIAGRVARAPRWMQRSGLEWIYRISQEPGRLWRRYAYGLVKYSVLAIESVCGRWR